MMTWFIFLTEPLVALNSYGIIYLSILIIITSLMEQKGILRNANKKINKF